MKKLLVTVFVFYISWVLASPQTNPGEVECTITMEPKRWTVCVGANVSANAIVNCPIPFGGTVYAVTDAGTTGGQINSRTGEITNLTSAGTFKFKAHARDFSSCKVDGTVLVCSVEQLQYEVSRGTYADGPRTVCMGEHVTLKAFSINQSSVYPVEEPKWSIVSKPDGAAVTTAGLLNGFSYVNITPDELNVTGEYEFKASCGTSSKTIKVIVIKIDSITLTETKSPNSTLTTNALTVTELTNENLNVCPNNHVELSYRASSSSNKILFDIEGTGATPSKGSFNGEGKVNITIPNSVSTALIYKFYVGCDVNNNDILDVEERQLSLKSTFITFNGLAKAQRVSVPTENLYPVKNDEHFEVGGEFKFVIELSNGVDSSRIRYQLWDQDGIDDMLTEGDGNSFDYRFGTGVDEGDVYVRWFCDANDNETLDAGESFLVSEDFYVKQKVIHTFSAQISNSLLGINLAQVQVRYNTGARLALKKDSANDWRACIAFNVTGGAVFVSTLSSGARPDPTSGVSPFLDEWKHWAAHDGLSVISGSNGMYTGIAPLGGGFKMILVWPEANANTAIHEFGHSRGLEHQGTSGVYIMHGVKSVLKNELIKSEVDNFESN